MKLIDVEDFKRGIEFVIVREGFTGVIMFLELEEGETVEDVEEVVVGKFDEVKATISL